MAERPYTIYHYTTDAKSPAASPQGFQLCSSDAIRSRE